MLLNARELHEIRTQLTDVLLALEILARRTELSERQATLAEHARQSAKRLQQTLEHAADRAE